MRKWFLLFSFLFIIRFSCFAQLDNLWLLGYASFGGSPYGNMNMVFSQNNLDSIYFYYRNMNFEFANASICDSNGNLLFYTNGVYIANALDDTMMNGSGLNPSFYTTTWNDYGLLIPQADIIIPKPENDSLYYLFHETNNYNDFSFYRPSKLNLSIINMRGDSGNGEVILKNYTLLIDTLVSGCITATKHANGRDWWVVVPEWNNDGGYYVVLVTPDTIEVVHHLNFYMNHLGIGQACFWMVGVVASEVRQQHEDFGRLATVGGKFTSQEAFQHRWSATLWGSGD